MADDTAPQIYLITPPEFEFSSFPDRLARVLDSTDVACVRMALATGDAARLGKAADLLRETCHARDVAVVVDSHVQMVEPFGLDGVHLPDGGRGLRKIRKQLGADAIIGAHCGASRHDGMNAGEAGADYIAFGPVGDTLIGDGTKAEIELFEWWSQTIELPVVAEGALDEQIIASLSGYTDFFGIGEEIWAQDDPVKALTDLCAVLG